MLGANHTNYFDNPATLWKGISQKLNNVPLQDDLHSILLVYSV